MAKHKLFLILCALIGALAAANFRAQQVNSGEAEPNVEVVASAQSAYASTLNAYQAGRASAEDVYRWSVRWLDAEGRSNTARIKHLERIKSLHSEVSAKHTEGLEGGEEVDFKAAAFYLAEAKSLIRQE